MSAYLEIVKELTGEVSFRDAVTKFTVKQLQEDAALFLNTENRGGIWIVDNNGAEINIQTENILRTEVKPNPVINFSGDSRALYELLETDFFYNLVNPFNSGAPFDIGNWNFITKKSDFPNPSGGVITLPQDQTWVIAGDIDLTGDRIVCAGMATIIGGSSETSYLTSTGLSSGVALITTEWTLAMQFVTFRDVDTCFDIDGSINPPLALDWTGVNFLNVPNIGLIDTCDNFVYTKGAFLSSKELVFDGTHGTIAFNNSLLQGDGLLGDIIRIPSTASISRRFRVIYSSIVAFTNTTGINVSTSATINPEGYILDTCNFSGGSTYLSGITYTDNKARFIGNRGIENSSSLANYFMNNNATVTTITTAGVAVKVAGTTTNGTYTQKFTHTSNRATYTGALTQLFKITAIASFTSGNNQVIGLYIYHYDASAGSGSLVSDSEMYATTSGSGRAESIAIQTILQLETNDYIEVWIENDAATTNITVEYLNLIAGVQ